MGIPHKYLPNRNITDYSHWPVRFPSIKLPLSQNPRGNFFYTLEKNYAPCRLEARFARNKYKDAAAEIGRNPMSKHQIQPEYGE